MTDRIYKPKQISGFPEWLPEYRAVELAWLDQIRRVFESYGFCNIETPAVETVEALLAAKGGETESEIYALSRLFAEDGAENREARLALHFDLTVPLARYVAQHFNDLVFPFKRYQLQKSYRGERPQKGRYREFYQCDIDIVNIDSLPLQCDADLAGALLSAYGAIGIPPVVMHVNNRKVIQGFLQGIGVADLAAVTRTLDKLDKIGAASARALLSESGLTPGDIDKCLALVAIRGQDAGFADAVRALGVRNDMLEEGLTELSFLITQMTEAFDNVIVNLGIIRGLDYYTGSVLEVRFADEKTFGALSIGGGGRYENLASAFTSQKLPGVGGSLGLTRLFGLLLEREMIPPGRRSPTDILVVLPDADHHAEAAATARALRLRGWNVELYHAPAKVKKQMAYAEKKGARFVWFPPFSDNQPHEVKNMSTGEQTQADPATWGEEPLR